MKGLDDLAVMSPAFSQVTTHLEQLSTMENQRQQPLQSTFSEYALGAPAPPSSDDEMPLPTEADWLTLGDILT